jgi:P27 family predicted phage terminase small subunit
MGARGPVPTPTGILKLRQSHHAKSRSKEPAAPEGRPEKPPSFTGKDGEHRKLWSKIIRLLESMPGILSTVDGGQLERYCRYFVRWRQIEASLEKYSATGPHLILANEELGPVFSKLSRESLRLDAALKQIEREFGLTPSARARLGCLRNGSLETVQRDEVEHAYFGSGVG